MVTRATAARPQRFAVPTAGTTAGFGSRGAGVFRRKAVMGIRYVTSAREGRLQRPADQHSDRRDWSSRVTQLRAFFAAAPPCTGLTSWINWP